MPSKSFDLTIDDIGPDVVVISLARGDASPEEVTELRDELKSHVDRGYRRFVFDCQKTAHFSSALIGTVITTVHAAREQKTVAMVGTPQHVEILKICRLNKRLPVLGDLQAALDAVRGGEPDGVSGIEPS